MFGHKTPAEAVVITREMSNREEREQHKAGKASRDAAFRAALDAPPGTPADGGLR